MAAMRILTLLPWIDWLALAVFVGLWVGYTLYSHRASARHGSGNSAMAAAKASSR